jgi:hypothetical protein
LLRAKRRREDSRVVVELCSRKALTLATNAELVHENPLRTLNGRGGRVEAFGSKTPAAARGGLLD